MAAMPALSAFSSILCLVRPEWCTPWAMFACWQSARQARTAARRACPKMGLGASCCYVTSPGHTVTDVNKLLRLSSKGDIPAASTSMQPCFPGYRCIHRSLPDKFWASSEPSCPLWQTMSPDR